MSIILISFVLVMKFTNSFLVSCRSISYDNFPLFSRFKTDKLVIAPQFYLQAKISNLNHLSSCKKETMSYGRGFI